MVSSRIRTAVFLLAIVEVAALSVPTIRRIESRGLRICNRQQPTNRRMRRRPSLSSSSHLFSTTALHPMEEGEREMNKTRTGAINGVGTRNKWRRLMPKVLRNDGTEDETAITTVDTLEDYKREVVDVKDKIVVVRFYAQWCKSCKAAFPLFQKMKADLPSVKYVMVPLTKDTAYIHSGLGVPSVPFGHIYHPDVGLVEERKINRKVFGEFRESLESYVRGSCDLPSDDEPSAGALPDMEDESEVFQ
mmetsp:Transcript_29358/g.66320  ORF Transcript_29358/g.66320 Transcript_29358/m.66320 type:complete len:247 (-) Transcript_29358:88-828(-)